MIDGDSDLSSVDFGHTSGLDLLKGEATAEADLTGILAGGLRDNWAEGVGWPWENTGGLSFSNLVSLGLLGWLVIVAFNTVSLPVLAKMHVDNHIVMLDHC